MRTAMLTLLFLLCTPAATLGELTVVEEETDEGTRTIFRMTVTPAAEPTPALKHRLRLRPHQYKPGNAATHYLRANSENGFAPNVRSVRKKFGEEFDEWYDIDTPLSDLPLDRVREAASQFERYVDNFFRPASERVDCDWGFHLSELRGTEIYYFLLPAIQESRSISRILALRSRLAIADGRYNDAIDHIRMNYRLAENIGGAPFLVCCLVGIAEQGLSNETILDLIAAPDSPNLYWALTELPRPLVDTRDAISLEASLIPRVFASLKDVETSEHSPDEWTRLLVADLKIFEEFSSLDFGQSPLGSATTRGLAATALGLVMYPEAKGRLLRSGMDAVRIEQMPVGQVLAIDAAREYRRIADQQEKWAYVPFPETRYQWDDSSKLSLGKAIADVFLPAPQAARTAEIRTQWQTDAIRVVESLRMHAALEGQFPVALEDVRIVPVPRNPITRQAYIYRRRGKTAVLELPFSDGMPGIAWRFELQLADSKKTSTDGEKQ